MGSRERMIVRFVLWLVDRYLREKYRLMTPAELNQVVDNYLAELPKLGVRLVYDSQHVGASNDEIRANDSPFFKKDKSQRRPNRRKPAGLETEKSDGPTHNIPEGQKLG